jgi:hypothetical protein
MPAIAPPDSEAEEAAVGEDEGEDDAKVAPVDVVSVTDVELDMDDVVAVTAIKTKGSKV